MTDSEESIELLINEYQKSFQINNRIFKKRFLLHYDCFKNIFDAQQNLFKCHYYLLEIIVPLTEEKRVLLAAYMKNMNSFVAVTELLKIGLYGSARIILRQIFEFLIIGKFASVYKDQKFIAHWFDMGTINISKQILNKLPHKSAELKDFYKLLCIYTHATSASQQLGNKPDINAESIHTTYIFCFILLECNYHLLNTHLFDHHSNYYYGKYYSADTIKKNKSKLKESFKILHDKYYMPGSNKLIREYKSSWKANSLPNETSS